MKKSTLYVLVSLILLLSGSVLLLRSYKLDLVHSAVVNAVILKAPPGYPEEEIRRVFSNARERAERRGREEDFLQELLRLSQRLEKIQSLSREELDEIIESL